MISDELCGQIVGTEKYGTTDGDPHDARYKPDKNTFNAVLFVNAMQDMVNAFSFYTRQRGQHNPCFNYI